MPAQADRVILVCQHEAEHHLDAQQQRVEIPHNRRLVKTSFKARKKRGEYVAAMPPYGYMKDPDRKRHLVPNPDTAGIIRRIFDMALSGTKPSDIAVTLNDEGIETPSRYFQRTHPDKKRYNNASAENCWTNYNVREILRRQEYIGSVVSNTKTWRGLDVPRTRTNDESEWVIVPDCHEAIVSVYEQYADGKITKEAYLYERDRLNHYIHCENSIGELPDVKDSGFWV